MSYILDALKKSETERARGVSPSLLGATQGTPLFTTRVIVLVAVALFVNAALLTAWWLWPRPLATSATDSASISTSPPATAVVPPSSTTTVAPLNAPPQPAETTASVPQVVPTSATRKPPEPDVPAQATTPATTQTPQTISFSELSAQEQKAFDGLEFSTHVFADDPSFRAVTLNGKRFKEGDPLTSELLLDRITEDGVVVEYRGKRVELPVLQDWRI